MQSALPAYLDRADEIFEAASLMATAVEKAPESLDVAQSAFQLRFGMTPYQWYNLNPERGSRFAAAMAGYGQSTSGTLHNRHTLICILVHNDPKGLRDRFPWEELGDALVVDVGGGSGHISQYLAHVSFTVILSAISPSHCITCTGVSTTQLHCSRLQ